MSIAKNVIDDIESTVAENRKNSDIPVIFQVAFLLAALTHPGYIVNYAPGDSLPCRRDAS
ncbi:hypothetical protein [Photorhabdus sp. SF281]|uniref:hypothetical protein n=1 Tax=Photorhabdus sp. SF281 TaxID=3459527 RepID=UPI004043B2B7